MGVVHARLLNLMGGALASFGLQVRFPKVYLKSWLMKQLQNWNRFMKSTGSFTMLLCQKLRQQQGAKNQKKRTTTPWKLSNKNNNQKRNHVQILTEFR